jgi:hypothetical protein
MGKFREWHGALSTGVKAVAYGAAALLVVGIGAAAQPSATQRPAEKQSVNKAPVIVTKSVEEKVVVPYETQTVDDATLANGATAVRSEGKNGEITKIFKVSYEGDKEVKRVYESESTTVAMQPKVVARGTYVKPVPQAPPTPSCDPNYSGCVPLVSYDLDCADIGFSVTVLGYDKHGFDRDRDGYGCESY